MEMAMRVGAPVIGLNDSGGARWAFSIGGSRGQAYECGEKEVEVEIEDTMQC